MSGLNVYVNIAGKSVARNVTSRYVTYLRKVNILIPCVQYSKVSHMLERGVSLSGVLYM